MRKLLLPLLLVLQHIAFAYSTEVSDTDLFVLKNGYSFKADLVDTSGKYYIYKVYRGERLLRCVKKTEVSTIKFNYVTPAPLAVKEPEAIEKPTAPVKPVVVEKKKFNPNSLALNVRKGFEVIDTVRIFYDQDITHYKTDENAVSAFSTPADLGPKFTQVEIDSSGYQGTKVNGKRQGSGSIYFDNGAVYSGKIANNVLQGFGYYSDEFIDYKGLFSKNMLNGLGLCYYFGIEDVLKDVVFKGEFRDGRFWEGELYYSTSDEKRYLQQFKQGNPAAAKIFDY